MTTILTKIRNLVNDNLLTNGSQTFTYYTSKIFTLAQINISSATVSVYKNGVVQATGWTYSSTTNKVTYTASLLSGDSIEIIYSYYKKYSDTEINGYIRSALSYLSIEGYKVFVCKTDNLIFPTPDESEENLIAVIASIIMGGNIKQYKTPEVTIIFQGDLSVEDRIRLVIRQATKSGIVLGYISLDENWDENYG